METSPARALLPPAQPKDQALADMVRGLPDTVLADLLRNLATAPLRRAL